MTDQPDVQDHRAAFCYQTLPALAAIREAFTGSRRATALAVYQSLTEAANAVGGSRARNGFSGARKRVAEMAGVSVDTLDRYLARFEAAGIIEILRSSDERGGTLPNVYVLLEVPSSAPLPGRTDAAPPGRTGAAPKEKEKIKSKETTTDVVVLGGGAPERPKTVDRVPVKDAEWETAVKILAAFNQAAGTRFTAKAWAPKIVLRIREHPELTLLDHYAVITANLHHPWWKGAASPSVIYGSAPQFERSMTVVGNPGPDRALTPDEIETYGTLWGPGTGYETLAAAEAAGSHPVVEMSTDFPGLPRGRGDTITYKP